MNKRFLLKIILGLSFLLLTDFEQAYGGSVICKGLLKYTHPLCKGGGNGSGSSVSGPICRVSGYVVYLFRGESPDYIFYFEDEPLSPYSVSFPVSDTTAALAAISIANQELQKACTRRRYVNNSEMPYILPTGSRILVSCDNNGAIYRADTGEQYCNGNIFY